MAGTERVLIVYASAGHGHEKAARGVEEALLHAAPGADVTTVDSIAVGRGFFAWLYRFTYFVQIKHAPWLWGFFYYSFDQDWVYAWLRYVRRAYNALNFAPFERYLVDKAPTTVVATHFQAVEVVSHLKRRGLLKSRLAVVITDYLPHHVWIDEQVDLYAVACDSTREDLLRRGVPAERIRVTGIPVERKFFRSSGRAEVRRALGLDETLFTALVTSGGAAIGALGDIVRELIGEGVNAQVLCVCGTNAALRASLEPLTQGHTQLRLYGFVDNMHELMEASDVVIGKGGGLTVTESLCKGRPLILYRPVPGQEGRNARVLQSEGAALVAATPRVIGAYVRELIDSPDKRRQLSSGAERLRRPGAAADIAGEVLRA
ncbi:MAG: Processive diacylglycerol beta-glucosyltransferase [Candidatus Omnitrophica bacterium]|nr:Processive diacylglycerol beta-glucosyltransferase [Candidatus Omnitrophota bacterium]